MFPLPSCYLPLIFWILCICCFSCHGCWPYPAFSLLWNLYWLFFCHDQGKLGTCALHVLVCERASRVIINYLKWARAGCTSHCTLHWLHGVVGWVYSLGCGCNSGVLKYSQVSSRCDLSSVWQTKKVRGRGVFIFWPILVSGQTIMKWEFR